MISFLTLLALVAAFVFWLAKGKSDDVVDESVAKDLGYPPGLKYRAHRNSTAYRKWPPA